MEGKDVAALVSSIRSSRTLHAASCAAVLWDHFTTFDQEAELIWSKEWSGTKILYILNRYLGDFAFLHRAVMLWASGGLLDKLCPSSMQVTTWLGMSATFAMNGIMVKRLVCMYSGNKKVLWILSAALSLLGIYSVVITIMVANLPNVIIKFQFTHTFEICRPTGSFPHWYWTFLFLVALFESVVFYLALLQGIRFVRETQRLRQGIDRVELAGHLWKKRRELTSVLFRDSILFPFINLTLAFLGILAWAVKFSKAEPALAIRTVSAAAVPILGCRLVLNLREAYYRPFRAEYTQSQLPDRSFLAPDSETQSASTPHGHSHFPSSPNASVTLL